MRTLTLASYIFVFCGGGQSGPAKPSPDGPKIQRHVVSKYANKSILTSHSVNVVSLGSAVYNVVYVRFFLIPSYFS